MIYSDKVEVDTVDRFLGELGRRVYVACLIVTDALHRHSAGYF